MGSQGHEKLLQQLFAIESTVFTSNYPVLMPITYKNEIQLRLDSNMIFYTIINITNFELYDMFSVKGGPSIKLDVGKWNFGTGFFFYKE